MIGNFNFIMTSDKLSNEHLRAIIETQYQHRSLLEHRTVLEIFLDFCNGCSDRARLLSYFAIVPETGPVEISAQTVLFRRSQEGFPFLVEIQQLNRVARRDESQLLILVPGEAVRKCQTLRWTSPENEVRLLQGFPLLTEIPRKKIYQILRHSRVVELRYGETFFREGSVMSNSFYLIREGEFSFSSHGPALKAKELLRFRAGYLFQHQSKFIVEGYEEYLSQGNLDLAFDYTVKCKSSRGIVYCIDSNFFNMHIFKFCQERLGKHLRNQSSFLAQASLKNIPSSQFSSITRPLSQQLQPLVAPNISSARSKPRFSSSSRVLDLLEKATDYRSVKESLPRRNRLFSKQELKKLMPDPEEDESDCLIWKKVKCERVKEMRGLGGKEMMGLGEKQSRGQILYNFTQSAIRFQKHRTRPSLL